MSFAAAARARVAVNGPKILTLDVERLPGRFSADFWDLNAFKGRRIHPDMVEEWPRTICVAWRWYGTKRTEFASEWGDGRDTMLKRAWDAFDQADIIYGHAVKRFDAKKLNTEWRDLGMAPPSPARFVDTLTEARKVFGDESFTLAALTQRVGVETKTDKYSVDVARAAVAGDAKAQRKLKAYNVGDIAASEALVDAIRAWIDHPNLAVYTDQEHACSNCGSTELTRAGWNHTAQTRYAQYRCEACGTVVRNNFIKGRALTRRAR